MPEISPPKAINKQILRQKPTPDELQRFKDALQKLHDNINPKEGEEHNKQFTVNFLNDTFYKEKNLVNTSGNTDCAIYDDNRNVAVIIETKSPTNRVEFPTRENLNSKAMQELLLYFMRERVTNKNFYITQLIITNAYEWFIFDAHEFERAFYDDSTFKKNYAKYANGQLVFNTTQNFYSEIAKPQIEKKQENIPFVCFDIRDIIKNDREIQNIYHLFSPQHLLKKWISLTLTRSIRRFTTNFYTSSDWKNTKTTAKKLLSDKKIRTKIRSSKALFID